VAEGRGGCFLHLEFWFLLNTFVSQPPPPFATGQSYETKGVSNK